MLQSSVKYNEVGKINGNDKTHTICFILLTFFVHSEFLIVMNENAAWRIFPSYVRITK